jgi:predicted DNA-binding protein
MTSTSTTIRVSLEQRERLRALARDRSSTMTETLDAALEALRRDQFYRSMVAAEAKLRSDPDAWAEYAAERDSWLGPELTP